MIAEAAHDLGLEGLTLKAVADHLGVTTAALYHHVDSKDDLLRAAAEHSSHTVPHPVDHGQHWAQWLLDWAHYNRAVFTAQPGLLGQYLEGAIPLEAVVRDLDTILSVLVREGFTVTEANEAYGLVSSCALGTMLSAKWEDASTRGTGGVVATYRRIVDAAPKRKLKFVRKLLYTKGARRPDFDERIETVLRGIAAQHGLRWKRVVHCEP
jgi:AcrR family transcriptional regulator